MAAPSKLTRPTLSRMAALSPIALMVVGLCLTGCPGKAPVAPPTSAPVAGAERGEPASVPSPDAKPAASPVEQAEPAPTATPSEAKGADSPRSSEADLLSGDRARVATRFLPAFGHDLEGLATSLFVEPESGRASLYVRDVQRYEFAIRRARTQGAARPGLFGAGWRSDLDARVEPEGEGFLVTRLRGQRRFVPSEAVPQGYVSDTGDVELLIKTEEGFQLRDHVGRTFRFDAEGRLSGIVPEFLLTRSEGRLVLEALADASTCELSLDAEGRVASGVFRAPGQPARTLGYHYQAGELQRVTRAVAGLEGETRYEVTEGRIARVFEDGREVLRLEHDAAGRISELRDGEHVQRYRYEAGRSQVTTPAGTWDLRYAGSAEAPSRWELSAPGQDEAYEVDGRGRLLIPDAMPRDTIAPARPLRQAAGSAAEEPQEQAAAALSEEEVALAGGGTRRTVGVPGAQVVEERDGAGRLVSRTTPDGRSETYAYGEREGLRVVRKTDALGGVTEFSYEGSRLVAVETPEGRRWTFQPQEREEGRRVSLVDGPGGKQRFVHDAQGPLVERSFATGESIRFGYDAAGEPVSAQGSDGSGFRNEYREGRLVARASQGLREELSSEGGHLTVKSPDATLRYSFGEREEVLESRFGRFVHREVAGAEPAVEIESPAGAFRFDYDGRGQRQRLSYPGGVELSWSYDGLGRVQEQRLEREGERLLTLGASWDERNERRVERRDGQATRYTYDGGGRLASVTLPSGATRSYAYDGDGNRTEEVRRGPEGGRQTLSGLYDRRGRLVSWGEERLRYDTAGRLLQRGEVRYAYNAMGQLTSVTRPGQPTLRYAYDALGHRVERRRGEALTRFVWDDDRLLAELGPGERTRVYVYGAGRDLPLAYCDREGQGPGEWVYLVANERHDVVAYLDAEGRVCDRASFLPFGELEQAPGAARPVFFAGKLVERETGLVHMGQRDYCPDLGRFLTPDPSGLHGGLNAYVYVSNRPLECVDPTGLSEEPSLLRSLWSRTRSAGEALLSEGRAMARRSPRQQLRRTLERVAGVGEKAHDLLERATGVDTRALARGLVEGTGDTLGAAKRNALKLAGEGKGYFVRGGRKAWRNVRDSAEGALHLSGLHSDSNWRSYNAAWEGFAGDWTQGAAHDRALGLLEYPAKAGDLYLRATNPGLHAWRGSAPDLRRYAFDTKEMDYGQQFWLGTVETATWLLPAGGPAKASATAVRGFGARALRALGQGGLRELAQVTRTNLSRQAVRALAGGKELVRSVAVQGLGTVADKLIHPAFSLATTVSVASLRRVLPGLGRFFTRSGARQARQASEQGQKAGRLASAPAPRAKGAAPAAAPEGAAPAAPPQEGILGALKDPAGRKAGVAGGKSASGSGRSGSNPGAKPDEPDAPRGKKSKKDGKVDDDGCFLAGTLVATAEGPRPIETIRAGQWVLSRDEASREQALKRVVRLFRGQTDQVVYLRVASQRAGLGGDRASGDDATSQVQTLRCTPEHPFWVAGRGFVPAGELVAGQRGLDSAGEELTFVSVEVRAEQAAHFNFEVEDFHTYFVSETPQDAAVWVHNSCSYSKKDAAELLERSEGRSPIQGQRPGHPKTHIPDDGVSPAAHAAKFSDKPLNTFYRSKAQAERDLREVLNAYKAELAALRPGQSLAIETHRLSSARQGFQSVRGAPPASVGFDSVFAKFYRTSSGELHLQTMYPKNATPFRRIP